MGAGSCARLLASFMHWRHRASQSSTCFCMPCHMKTSLMNFLVCLCLQCPCFPWCAAAIMLMHSCWSCTGMTIFASSLRYMYVLGTAVSIFCKRLRVLAVKCLSWLAAMVSTDGQSTGWIFGNRLFPARFTSFLSSLSIAGGSCGTITRNWRWICLFQRCLKTLSVLCQRIKTRKWFRA